MRDDLHSRGLLPSDDKLDMRVGESLSDFILRTLEHIAVQVDQATRMLEAGRSPSSLRVAQVIARVEAAIWMKRRSRQFVAVETLLVSAFIGVMGGLCGRPVFDMVVLGFVGAAICCGGGLLLMRLAPAADEFVRCIRRWRQK